MPMATQPQESAGSDAVVSQKTPQESDAAGQPGSSIDNPIDLSDGIIEIQSKEKSINTPDVFGHEMVYSAGTGFAAGTAAQDAVSLRSGNRRGKQGRQRADQKR